MIYETCEYKRVRHIVAALKTVSPHNDAAGQLLLAPGVRGAGYERLVPRA